uniref:Homeobox-leucine zipper protein n=2 Tax=Solanum TaxID=4107 RepID=M1C8G6_SOLTU
MCPSCEHVATGPTNTPVNIPPHRVGPPHQHHQPMPLNMWGPSSTPISQGHYGQMDTYPTFARQK